MCGNPKIGNKLVVVLVAYFLGCSLSGLDANGAVHYCPDKNFIVISQKQVGISSICRAAKTAASFLERNGLFQKENIKINIVRKFPPGINVNGSGCYDVKRKKVYILEIDMCRSKLKKSVLFGSGPPEEVYRSLIAHEIAHAIVLQNFPIKRPSWIAQEYVAYVTQLATLPLQHRRRILARVGGRGFRVRSQITATILLASPDYFAANAYRHFSTLQNGTTTLRELLTEKAD